METHRYYSKWRQNQTSANPQLSHLYGLSRNHTACGMGVPLSIFDIMWAQVSRALMPLKRVWEGVNPPECSVEARTPRQRALGTAPELSR